MVFPPSLARAVEAVRAGHMVVMVDDEKRENEGDLVLAAQYATRQNIAFMARQGCGLICLALEARQIEALGLSQMVEHNRDARGTAFTVSIEAAQGITTGISAAERAHTIRVASAPGAGPQDIVSPGHMFPLKAHPQGVLARQGHTEGAVDLMALAGLEPAGVICEIMAEDGHMMRLPELRVFAARHHLPLVNIAELRDWIAVHGRQDVTPLLAQTKMSDAGSRWEREADAIPLSEPVANLPSCYGGEALKIHAFRGEDGAEHVALVHGTPEQALAEGRVPLVRLHSECVTGDALGSLRCDCGAQLHEALGKIAREPCGVLVYLRGHEGRGIGLENKIRAYNLQDRGFDTVDANEALGLPVDARTWGMAARILTKLGILRLRLLTNNPKKAEGLEKAGLDVTAMEPLEIKSTPFNHHYLETKRTRMGHVLKGTSDE